MTAHPSSDKTDWNHALYLAAKGGDIAGMEQALRCGADINSRHTDNHSSILHAAANSTRASDAVKAVSRYELCRFALDNGADPDLPTRRGFTCLHTAANANDAELAELLLDYGANPNVFSKTGTLTEDYETPLHEAARKNRRECIRPLLEAGADPLLTDPQGRTVAQGVSEMWMDVLSILDDFQNLPRVDGAGEITKAALLERRNGACALDNPVTWRKWDAICTRLAAQGESFGKEELLAAGEDGRSYLLTAARARMLDTVVEQLNGQGESLSVAELLGADDGFAPLLARPHVPRALFTHENMAPQGAQGVMRNYRDLPEAGRGEVGNVYQLAETFRAEANRAIGR